MSILKKSGVGKIIEKVYREEKKIKLEEMELIHLICLQ